MSPTATTTKAKGSDSRKRRQKKSDSSEKSLKKKRKILNEAPPANVIMEPNESPTLNKSKGVTIIASKTSESTSEERVSKIRKRITRSQSSKSEAGISSRKSSVSNETKDISSRENPKYQEPEKRKEKRKYVTKSNAALRKCSNTDEIVKKGPGRPKKSETQAKLVVESNSKPLLKVQNAPKSKQTDTNSAMEQSSRKKMKETAEDEPTKNKKEKSVMQKGSELIEPKASKNQQRSIQEKQKVGKQDSEKKDNICSLKARTKSKKPLTKGDSKGTKSRQKKHITTKSIHDEDDASSSESSEALRNELPAFSRTNKNLRKTSNKTNDEDELPTCYCIYGDLCDVGCLNRSSQIECDPSYCPCKENCTNQRFQKAQYADVSPVHCKDSRGWGLFANRAIGGGEFVIEYTGEIISDEQFKRRIMKYHEHFYFMKIGTNEIIDARVYGNDSRFANHSCDPNCRLEKWLVGGYIRAGLFALRKINKGEEITYDYKFDPTGNQNKKCLCKAKNCKGFLLRKTPESKTKDKTEGRKKSSPLSKKIEKMDDGTQTRQFKPYTSTLCNKTGNGFGKDDCFSSETKEFATELSQNHLEMGAIEKFHKLLGQKKFNYLWFGREKFICLSE